MFTKTEFPKSQTEYVNYFITGIKDKFTIEKYFGHPREDFVMFRVNFIDIQQSANWIDDQPIKQLRRALGKYALQVFIENSPYVSVVAALDVLQERFLGSDALRRAEKEFQSVSSYLHYYTGVVQTVNGLSKPEDKISDSTQANAFMDGLLPSIQQLSDIQESTTLKSAIDQALRAVQLALREAYQERPQKSQKCLEIHHYKPPHYYQCTPNQHHKNPKNILGLQ